MTALREALEHTALGWIKPELDETLRLAKAELEDYVEDSADVGRMRLCAGYLHQVQGTLRMVELYAPAMVAEEMEQVAQALHAGTIAERDAACSTLLRGIVLLPDYLERLQSGHRDIPIVLLPLLNELRAARGESGLSESVLFSPDLNAELPSSAAGAKAPLAQAVIAANTQKLRLAFQFGLLKWFKGEDVDGNLTRLIAILDRVRSLSHQVDARRLWWVGAGALEAVLVKGLESSVALKLLVGRVDRELKRLIDSGEPLSPRRRPAMSPRACCTTLPSRLPPHSACSNCVRSTGSTS
jgi:chemosensory pili system protein ChpA (sensor histidine kinase/response regulator)